MACVCPRRFRDGICFPSWLRCALWYLFFPLIWLYHSVRIYCCTCVYSYIVTCCARLWLYIGDHCCCCFKSCSCCLRRACCICLPYKDAKHFPPSAGSIGEWKGMTGKQIATKIEWRRANEICKLAEGEHIRLFSGKIEPGDIGQGQLGDCWLMTSLACLAEFPGAIQHVFLTDEYNPRGRYVLQLYDPKKKEWEEVVVDDWVPCEAGTTDPIFAQPRGKELWVALLEKAFAKMSGSYGALSGGHMLYGLQVLTGDHAERWEHGSGGWSALEIKYDPKSESRGNEGFFKFLPSQRWKEALDNDAFFEKMRAWHEAECVLAAGTSGTDEGEATAQQGLVQGHAYSILDLKKVGGIKLLQLRNPWGSFEWSGDWSDDSSKWAEHPKCAKACGHEGAQADGIFWMEFTDFRRHYRTVDVCHRSRGIRDVRIDLHEDAGCVGPIQGCCVGCARYYCCCQGCCRLCWPTDHRHQIAAAPSADMER